MAMDRLAWLLSPELGRAQFALLVVCTLAMRVLAATLVWRLFYLGTGHKFVVSIGHSWIGQWAVQITRLLYYVGIPLATLGRRDLRQMGLPGTLAGVQGGDLVFYLLGVDKTQDLMQVGVGIAMGVGALALLVAVWVWYARVLPSAGEWPAVPWWKALREAFFLQVLWAFYRSFVSTLTLDGIYVAFSGLALVAVSWLFDPLRRSGAYSAYRGYVVAQDWMFALFTALMAIEIDSLWLLVLMHSVWLWAGDQVLRSVSRFPARSTPRPSG
jgi:hypothetical protein